MHARWPIPSRESPGGPRRRAVPRAIRATWLLFLATSTVVFGWVGAEEFRFQRDLDIVNQRARKLGGGVLNGRRHYRRHVGVWVHGEGVTDSVMPEVVRIVDECRARGLGKPHLLLDLSRTGIGDEGIGLLHGVMGLNSIDLEGTKVTEAGVRALQHALPHTTIRVRPPASPFAADAAGGPS